MSVFQWMYCTIYMPSWCNSVRVVLLIARGWRGTSLPRVNVRKEIQRHRCWAFSVKARSQWNLSWRITLRKRNTYGVDSNYLHAKMSRMTKHDVYKHNAIRLILCCNLSQNMQWFGAKQPVETLIRQSVINCFFISFDFNCVYVSFDCFVSLNDFVV